MKPKIKVKLENIFSYPFFQSVGAPLPTSVTSLKTWSAAARMCNSHKWNSCQLMARNALQRFTEKNWERTNEWNPLVQEIRPLIHSFVDELLLHISAAEKNLKTIKDSVSWDIMLICLEHEYRDLVEPFFGIPIVEPWYAMGHFPCGWDGDEFPAGWDGKVKGGQLMVF